MLTLSSFARASPKYWVCGLISCEQWDCPGSSSFCLRIVQSPVDLGLSTFEFNQEGERRTTVQSKVSDSPVHSWKGWLSGAVPYFQQINEQEENPYLFASRLRIPMRNGSGFCLCGWNSLATLRRRCREKRRFVEEADGGGCNRKGTEQLNKTKIQQSTWAE